jgi:hypothetical protein
MKTWLLDLGFCPLALGFVLQLAQMATERTARSSGVQWVSLVCIDVSRRTAFAVAPWWRRGQRDACLPGLPARA